MPGATTGWSARQGLLTAASVVLSVVVGAWLGLPDLWWAAISAWVVSNPDFGALWLKLVMRLAGTIFGLFIGFEVATAIEGLPLFQALALFAACGIGTYKRFSSRYGYAWFYGAFTIAMVLSVSLTQPKTLFAFAEFRLVEIMLGVVSAAFVNGLAYRPGPASAPAEPPASGPRPELVRLSLVAALSALAMASFWAWFDIPALPQALASTLTVVDRDLATMRARARQRLLGCAFGAALGLAALYIDLASFAVYLTVLFAGIFYFSRLHHGGGRMSYIGTQGGLAYITAMVTGGGPPAELAPVLARLAGVVAGVTLMLCVSFVLGALTRPRDGDPADASQERLSTT
jgi:uncharacterized membrane protein YccC